MIVNMRDKAKDLYYSNAKSGLSATNAQDAIDEVSGKVDQIAGNQIPEEYLEAAVDEYVNNNSAGFATQVNLEEVESQLSSEIEEIENTIGYVISGFDEPHKILSNVGVSISVNDGELNASYGEGITLQPILYTKNKIKLNLQGAEYLVLGVELLDGGSNYFKSLCLSFFDDDNYRGKLVTFTKDANNTSYDWGTVNVLGATFDKADLEITNHGNGSFTISDGTHTANVDVTSYTNFDFAIGVMTERTYSNPLCIEILGNQKNVDERLSALEKIFNGKIGNFFGDSIIDQGNVTTAFQNLFGVNVNKYGISGSFVTNYYNNPAYSRVAGMSDNCDFVFSIIGTNDWGYGALLGGKTDTTADTFYGGLYLFFKALREKYLTKPIYISTIIQRDWTDTATDANHANGIDSNKNGNSIEEFNDAIRYMAKRYGIVVIDAYGESGICIPNIATYTTDRLHPNALGGEKLARFYMQTISNSVE